MTRNDVNKLRHGLYRLYWKEGGSSLASVGSLYDGVRWYAPINWTNQSTTGIACDNWRKVERVELLVSDDRYMRPPLEVVKIVIAGDCGRSHRSLAEWRECEPCLRIARNRLV